jgi:ADP-ribose pyrophosphatase YjhB (NUDIX family)
MSGLTGWKYCPRCAAEVEPASGVVRCAACGFTAYANSEPTACALIADERGRLLLARRAGEPERAKWDLPGGFLDEGEHPLDGLRRELHEETGLDVEPDEFVGVWMNRYGEGEEAPWTLNLYWTAHVVSGEAAAADDVSELRWFDPKTLPPPEELAFHVGEVISAWLGMTPSG